MGRDVPAIVVSHADRRRYREKVRRCLDVFARMLHESRFTDGTEQVGLEVEFNLVDEAGSPFMRTADVLAAIGDPGWSPELGRFNVEVNLPPRPLTGDALATLERLMEDSYSHADQRAQESGSRLAMIGILPSLREHHATEEAMSPNPRYRLLNEQICVARGEEMQIFIEGPERLLTHVASIMPEAACTSVQCHLQVSPETFGSYWNAAQAVAGVQVAVAANSPYLFGRELWQETRIPLFEQAIDTRPAELEVQGVRPRVWFGERWITSVFDLFEENLRYFPSLLPLVEDEDPVAELDGGGIPQLSGPTVTDVVANAAFYYGLVHMLVEAERPIWSQMSFAAAHDNLMEGARHGLEARLYWPGLGEVPAAELTLRRLLALAYEGLCRRGVDTREAERLLAVIEQRCLTGRTGASWQTETVHALEERSGLDRDTALREMTQRYLKLMTTGEPVHTWPVA